MSNYGPIGPGKNVRLAAETWPATKTQRYPFTLDAESAQITIYFDNIEDEAHVRVYHYIGNISENKNELLQDFGVLLPSHEDTLISRKTAISTSQLFVEVSATAWMT